MFDEPEPDPRARARALHDVGRRGQSISPHHTVHPRCWIPQWRTAEPSTSTTRSQQPSTCCCVPDPGQAERIAHHRGGDDDPAGTPGRRAGTPVNGGGSSSLPIRDLISMAAAGAYYYLVALDGHTSMAPHLLGRAQ